MWVAGAICSSALSRNRLNNNCRDTILSGQSRCFKICIKSTFSIRYPILFSHHIPIIPHCRSGVRDHRDCLEGRPEQDGPEMRAAPASEGQSCERRDPVHQELAEGQLSQATDAATAARTCVPGVDETGAGVPAHYFPTIAGGGMMHTGV